MSNKVTILLDDGTRIDGYLRTKAHPSMGVHCAVSSPNGVSFDLALKTKGDTDKLVKRSWYEVVVTARGETAGVSAQYRGIDRSRKSYTFQTGQLPPTHDFRSLSKALGVE